MIFLPHQLISKTEITENTLKAFDEASSNPKNDTTGFQWQGVAGTVSSKLLYFDNEEKLFKSRNKASTVTKMEAMRQIYDDANNNSEISFDDKYKEQQGFRKNILTPTMVYDMLVPLGGQEQDIKNVYERAKSEEHLTALIAETTDKIKRREVQNEILTEGEQNFARVASLIFSLKGLFVSLLLLIFFYILYKQLKNLLEAIKQRVCKYKVQKIAEDEAIRATVNKAVNEDTEDGKELQELINKAVAKGDTETAQSLLAILERRKDK